MLMEIGLHGLAIGQNVAAFVFGSDLWIALAQETPDLATQPSWQAVALVSIGFAGGMLVCAAIGIAVLYLFSRPRYH
ncbi:MAG: hypothetical protein GX613_04205 [Chloroflexi bacterium]|nr:hypothetical protein [Chloroflexota bacterium]